MIFLSEIKNVFDLPRTMLEQVMDDADNFHRRKWEKVVHVPALIVHNRIV